MLYTSKLNLSWNAFRKNITQSSDWEILIMREMVVKIKIVKEKVDD